MVTRSSGSFVTLFMLVVMLSMGFGMLLVGRAEFLQPQATAIAVDQWRFEREQAQLQLDEQRAALAQRLKTQAVRDEIMSDALRAGVPGIMLAMAIALVMVAGAFAWRIANGPSARGHPPWTPPQATKNGDRSPTQHKRH